MARLDSKNILEIISKNDEQIYIPIYQRNYDWKAENSEKLLLDIWEFKNIKNSHDEALYYLGDMVWKKITNDHDAGTKISLIDGQQRLTTLLLMIKAISDFNSSIDVNKYIYSDSKNSKRYKISRSKSEDVLVKILEGKELSGFEMESNYYLNYITMKETIKNENIDALELYKILDSVEVSWVMLFKYEDENKVFETINSTGKPLENKDLIKNFIFSNIHNLSDKEEAQIENIYNLRIEDIFENKEFKVNTFYRYFVASINGGKLANENGKDIYFAFKNSILKKGYDLSNYHSLNELVSKIQKAALLFESIVIPKNEMPNKIEDSKIIFYKELLRNNMTLYPMYYSLRNETTEIEDNQIVQTHPDFLEKDILILISKYYFFREITNRKMKNITRDVPMYFMNYKKTLSGTSISLPGFEEYLNKRESNDQMLPKIKDVIPKIKDVTYSSRKLVKNILIASEIASKDINPYDKFGRKIQIEHIFPQTPDKWKNDFIDMGKVNKYYDFNEKSNNISNLTILTNSLNKNISNSIFKVKRDQIIKESDFNINAIFKEYNEYNNEFLKDRINFIIENFAKFYNFDINVKKIKEKNHKYIENIESTITKEMPESNFNWIQDKEIQNELYLLENNLSKGVGMNGVARILRNVIDNVLEKAYYPNKRKSLFEKIKGIEESGKIDKEIINNLNRIRMDGNNEVHSLNASNKSKTHFIRLLEMTSNVISYVKNIKNEFNSDIYYGSVLPSPLYKYKEDLINEKVYGKVLNKSTIDELSFLKNIISKADTTIRRNLEDDEIFKYIPYRETPSSGYIKNNIDIFNNEYTKKCLFEYLYHGIGGPNIDNLLSKGTRTKGYITSVTLAFLNIETNRIAKGSLSNIPKEKAQKLINDFVDKYHS